MASGTRFDCTGVTQFSLHAGGKLEVKKSNWVFSYEFEYLELRKAISELFKNTTAKIGGNYTIFISPERPNCLLLRVNGVGDSEEARKVDAVAKAGPFSYLALTLFGESCRLGRDFLVDYFSKYEETNKIARQLSERFEKCTIEENFSQIAEAIKQKEILSTCPKTDERFNDGSSITIQSPTPGPYLKANKPVRKGAF